MTSDRRQSVLILGAGPAGLTAAYRLVQRGLRVTLFEAAPTVGQSLLARPDLPILGCHHATRNMLRALGSPIDRDAFDETALEFRLRDGRLARYPHSRLPTPLHIVSTIGRFTGLSWRERWTLLSWLEQLWEGAMSLSPDLEHRTAQDWLTSLGQSRSLQESVWNPFATWLTGNELGRLSADALVNAVAPFLLRHASDGRIVLPQRSWHDVFVQPILEAVTRAGGNVARDAKAVLLDHDQSQVTGVRLHNGSFHQADAYLVALPHRQLTALLPDRWLSRYAYFQQISELTSDSYLTIQAHIPAPGTRHRLILLNEGRFRSVFVRPARDGQLCIISGLSHNSAPGLKHEASSLLQSLQLEKSVSHMVGWEQRDLFDAVLSLAPGTKARRPLQRSPIKNLFVAGAWTDTGWPSNLESAIISAERCVEALVGPSQT